MARTWVFPAVWFAYAITSFSGVTFVLFCFVFVLMLSLKPRPFVQSSFDMLARCTTRRASLYTSGETSTTMPTCPSKSTGAYATHGAASRSTPSNCTTDRQNPDAKSRGTRDNAVRLRHVEPARVPLRHAASSPPQVLDSLHRLAKAQSRRPPDFLSGHVYQDGK